MSRKQRTNRKVEEHNRGYWFDAHTKTYITHIPGRPTPLVVPQSDHDRLISQYSDWDGEPATLAELGRAWGMSERDLRHYFHAHEVYHRSAPWSRETIAESTIDALADDAIASKARAVEARVKRAQYRSEQRNAQRWLDFKAGRVEPIAELWRDRKPPTIKKVAIRKAQEDYSAVIGLTDPHFGKYAEAGECGEDYNRRVCRDRLFAKTEEALSDLAKWGRPEFIFAPIGSDFFHADTDKGTTTRGTPLDLDGTPAEIFVEGCDLMEQWIGMLAQVAPVKLVAMQGNHDRLSGLWLLSTMARVYRDSRRVDVLETRRPRAYAEYGVNLIGFAHGDGRRAGDTRDLSGLMANDRPAEWARCSSKTIYTGHLHHTKADTDTAWAVRRIQLPSLASADRWHTREGYEHAPKSLPVFIHSKERGRVGMVEAPVI